MAKEKQPVCPGPGQGPGRGLGPGGGPGPGKGPGRSPRRGPSSDYCRRNPDDPRCKVPGRNRQNRNRKSS